MNEEIRRVTGIILRAPFTGRTVRELLYCGLGGLAGVAGFLITIVMLALGLTISVSVLGTVIGLLLLTLALRVSRRLGALHRRLAGWLLRYRVEAPQRFQPGNGILGRLDQRLRDRAAWRAVSYSLIKLPVAAVQLYAITPAVHRPGRRQLPDRLAAVPPQSRGTGCSPMVALYPCRSARNSRSTAGRAPSSRPSSARPA